MPILAPIVVGVALIGNKVLLLSRIVKDLPKMKVVLILFIALAFTPFLCGSMCTEREDVSPFPFSGWTRQSQREGRSVSCLDNCVCTMVQNNTLIMDCSLAANGIGVVHSDPFTVPSNGSNPMSARLLITGSELDELNEKAFQGMSFHRIHIKYNHGLTSIPSRVLEHSKSVLSVLDLRNNKLSTFPLDTLSMFEVLEYISLDDNLIPSMPKVVSNHQRLIYLSISNNKLTQIEKGALNNLPNLKFLDLHGNLLNTLVTPFEGVNSLHSLILFGNILKDIRSGVFEQLVSLELLDLSFCSLKELSEGALAIRTQKPLSVNLAQNPLSSLEVSTFHPGVLPLWLNLRGTHITHLPEGMFRPLLERMANSLTVHQRFGLPRITLEDAELSCDCSAKWIATSAALRERVEGLCVHKKLLVRRLDPDYFYRFCF